MDPEHAVCQICQKKDKLSDLDRQPDPEEVWFCSVECERKRACDNRLWLLPGSTNLCLLESKIQDENFEDSHVMFLSIDKLLSDSLTIIILTTSLLTWVPTMAS